MSQLRRVEGQTELKCHADKFFDFWACKPHNISKVCSNKITKVELVKGKWHKVGAVKDWTYNFNDDNGQCSVLTLRTRVEELDVKKRTIRYSYHDGFILKNYWKTFKSKMEVAPNCNGCIVKWSFEYEKMNEDSPEPNVYIDYLLDLAKQIDAHFCRCT